MTFSSPRPAYTVDAISPMRPTLPPETQTENVNFLCYLTFLQSRTGLILFYRSMGMLTAVYQADPPFHHFLPHLLCALNVLWIIATACTTEYSNTSDGVVTIMPSAIFSKIRGARYARHIDYL